MDIDANCLAIAPGTGTPNHGEFRYYEVLELLQKVTISHDVAGIDLVKVDLNYDPTGRSAVRRHSYC